MTEPPMADWPKIPGAKGIVWRIQRGRKECRWQARPDIVKRGWKIKTHLLWQGAPSADPDDFQKSFIADRSSSLQSDMLFFRSRAGAASKADQGRQPCRFVRGVPERSALARYIRSGMPRKSIIERSSTFSRATLAT
jgi:hypothetical protein